MIFFNMSRTMPYYRRFTMTLRKLYKEENSEILSYHLMKSRNRWILKNIIFVDSTSSKDF